MQDQTVSDQIKELLEKGMSSTEVIAHGYRPGTVYKAQRNLRRVLDRTDEKDGTPVTVRDAVDRPVAEDDESQPRELQSSGNEDAVGAPKESALPQTDAERREFVEYIRAALEEDRLKGVIGRLKTANRELKEENGRLKAQLSSRTRFLNAQLREAGQRAEAAATAAWQWQKRFEDEKLARETLQRKLASGILITR